MEVDNHINFLMLEEILLQAGYECYEAVSKFLFRQKFTNTLKQCRTLVKVTSAQTTLKL
jgi:hypothetical protein